MKRITWSIALNMIAAYRPDLGITEVNDTKGYYVRNQGPAASFQGGFKTWRGVLQALEIIP